MLIEIYYRIVAAIAAFCLILLVFFLPETFWDRTAVSSTTKGNTGDVGSLKDSPYATIVRETERQDSVETAQVTSYQEQANGSSSVTASTSISSKNIDASLPLQRNQTLNFADPLSPRLNPQWPEAAMDATKSRSIIEHHQYESKSLSNASTSPAKRNSSYTEYWRDQPPKSFTKSLLIFPGRLSNTPYHLIMIRPFILFAYPSIAWASLTYACSVGWLIVLSESISSLYRNRDTYNFTAFETGLIYLSAFVGGVLGTAVAGKASDIVVKAMSKRNGGVYEPEFRLVMMVPVAICSVAGLMGFGWSIEIKDMYMVPTVFFGLISFGCSLGSTVAISFAVDCYREFAGEALVTLNFSKSKSIDLLWVIVPCGFDG